MGDINKPKININGIYIPDTYCIDTINDAISPNILNPNILNFNVSHKDYIQSFYDEKKYMEQYIYNLKYTNLQLLQHIHYLNNRCYLKNVTHNNTINFILNNYCQLKKLLTNSMSIYNQNLITIQVVEEEIYSINVIIQSFTNYI